MKSSYRFLALSCLLLTFSLIAQSSFAAIRIPGALNKSHRQEALRILGFGTSTKILSDPYPLGGFAGLEVGFSVENLPTEDLGRLGSRLESPQQDVALAKFTIGKGVYNNIDVFFNFTPYNRQDELSQYGGILRWGFYQATFLPLSASVLAHFNHANISNKLTVRSYGADLIGGINVNDVALFAGVGLLEARGTFIGGVNGVTDTNNIEAESVKDFHTLIGATIHMANVFFSLQIDRYTQPVFSAKIGLRF